MIEIFLLRHVIPPFCRLHRNRAQLESQLRPKTLGLVVNSPARRGIPTTLVPLAIRRTLTGRIDGWLTANCSTGGADGLSEHLHPVLLSRANDLVFGATAGK